MSYAAFSEFSYGYAMTDNILHSGLPYTPNAPVFLSLLAEGGAGGGYDVSRNEECPLIGLGTSAYMWRRCSPRSQAFTTYTEI